VSFVSKRKNDAYIVPIWFIVDGKNSKRGYCFIKGSALTKVKNIALG
jgi:hypothetical protein